MKVHMTKKEPSYTGKLSLATHYYAKLNSSPEQLKYKGKESGYINTKCMLAAIVLHQ